MYYFMKKFYTFTQQNFKKLRAIRSFIAVTLLCVMAVFSATAQVSQFTYSDTLLKFQNMPTSNTGAENASVSGIISDLLSYSTAKGNANNNTCYWNANKEIRMYSHPASSMGSSITFFAKKGAKIKEVHMHRAGSDVITIGCNVDTAADVLISVDSKKYYNLTGINADSVKLRNALSGGSSKTLKIDTIKIVLESTPYDSTLTYLVCPASTYLNPDDSVEYAIGETVKVDTLYSVDNVDTLINWVVAAYPDSIASISCEFPINVIIDSAATGTITCDLGTIYYKNTPSYTITADPCHEIDQVLVDGTPVTITNKQQMVYTFEPVETQGHEIEVSFKDTYYAIDVNFDGIVNPSENQLILCADSFSYELPEFVSHYLINVTVGTDTIDLAGGNTLTIDSVGADVTFVAHYALNEYSINYNTPENGTVAGPVSALYGETPAYTFTPEECYQVASVLIDNVDVTDELVGDRTVSATYTFDPIDSVHDIIASFEMIHYDLTTIYTGNGFGHCSPETMSVPCHDTVLYTITAGVGSYISSYTVTNANGSTTMDMSGFNMTSFSFNLDRVSSNTTVKVVFNRYEQNVTVVNATGNGTICCDTAVLYGDSCIVRVDADAANGYHIDYIINGTDTTFYTREDVSAEYRVYDIIAPVTVTAGFAINEYRISTVFTPEGYATAIPVDTIVNYGEPCTISMTTDACHYFTAVADSGAYGSIWIDRAVPTEATAYTINYDAVTTDHVLAVSVAPFQFTLTGVNMTGSHGTVPTVDADCGEPYDYTITAEDGYHITQVMLGSRQVYRAGINDQLTTWTYHFDQVLNDTTFRASFQINKYPVTATVTPARDASHATITGVPHTSVNYGTSETITVTPSECWHIAALLVNGEDVLADATEDANHVVTYTFNVVDTTAIEAQIEKIVYNLAWEVIGGENGQIIAEQGANGRPISTSLSTIKDSTTRNCGAAVYFNVTAAEGYHIATLSRNGVVETNNDNAFSDTIIKIDNAFQDEDIQVEFALNSYAVNTVIAGTNTVAPATIYVDHGANDSVVISVNDEYHHIASIACGDSIINLGANDDTTYTYYINNVVSDTDINVVIGIDTLTAHFDVAANGKIVRTNGFNPYMSTLTEEADWNGKQIVVVDPAAGQYIGAGSYDIKYLAAPFFTINFNTVPADCYAIDTLSTAEDNTVVRPTDGSINLPADEEYAVSVNFYQLEYNLTASVNGDHGTVAPVEAVATCGTDAEFTMTPEAGYHVSDITVNTVAADLNDLVDAGDGTYTYTISNVREDEDVIVTFAINTYDITASFTDGNGTFSPATTAVAHGDTVTLAVSLLSSCEHVDTLTINGEKVAVDSLVNGSNYQFVATGNTDIEATTTVNHYRAYADIQGEGTVSQAIVNCNEDHTYTIVPATGWHIESYTINGTTTTLGSNDDVYASVSVNNIVTDTAITVVFKRNTFTLTAQVDRGMGSWNVTTIALPYGDSYDFVATADAANGWHVDRIICGDSVTIYSGNQAEVTYTINPVFADTLLRAYFAVNQYTLSASVTGDGTITPVGDSVVIDRATVAYTIHANNCSYINQVLVDGVEVEVTDSTDMTYTFNAITSDHTIAAVITPKTYYMASTVYGEGTATEGFADCSNAYTYEIDANHGYHIDHVVFDGETIATFTNQEGHYEYAVSNVTTTHMLEAYFAINHYSVTSTADENGSILLEGTHDYVYGDNANFTISAEGCYHINAINVNGEDVVTFTNNENLYVYSLENIDTDYVINATFAPNTYSVSASAGANGTITPAGDSIVSCGASVSYTFTPDAGYEVAAVFVNNENVGVHSSYTISNISADNTIEVRFVATTYNVTATAFGFGTVTPAAVTVLAGDTLAIACTPAPCYSLSELLVNGVSYLDQVVNDTLMLNDIHNNMNVVASYQITKYYVTATAGVGGTITESNEYNCGSEVVYEINVDPCYTISSVEIDGVRQPIATTYTFPAINADHTIDVAFTINTYSVIAAVNNNALGTITPAGTNTYNCGTTIDYTITPATGAHIVSVTLDGEDMGAVENLRIAQIDANHSILVTFAQNTYTIDAYANGHVTVLPRLGETTVNYGGSVAYTFTVDNCYNIVDVIVNGVSYGSLNGYSFLNVTEDQTLQIVTEVKNYTISASVNDVNAGSITPAGVTVVDCDASQTYNIAAANGYYIADVKVNGNSVGAVSTYTFNNVNANASIVAEFAELATIQYTINSSVNGGNGTINPNGIYTVNRGESVTYTMTPDEYYTVGEVLVDGVSAGAVTTYTFANVTDDHTIVVTFVAAECDVPTYVYTTDITGTSATLNWSDMGATSYTVRYKKTTEDDYTEITGITANTYSLTGLTEMTSYVWNVKSVCITDEAESMWSNQVAFTTTATGINEAQVGALNVYSSANNIYVVNNSVEVIKSVQVFDMFGREVYAGQAQNNDVIALQAATGNYIVKVVTDKQVHNYKVNIFQR